MPFRQPYKTYGLALGAGLSLACGCLHGAPKDNQPNSRPNVVLITADDLGMQVGCYGDKIIKTPNMDRLYQEGVKFSNAYVPTASCSPSRAAILTGLYPHENGQIGLSHMGFSMHKMYPAIPNLLKKAGYRTGVIGKIHVNPEKDFQFDYHSDYHKWKYNTKEIKKVAASAKEFLSAKSKAPFFLYVNFFDPHAKLEDQVDGIPQTVLAPKDMPNGKAPKVFNSEGYDVPPIRFGLQHTASYYNQVRRLDEGVGLLLKELEAAGKLDNSLVIFISDHGIKGKTTCRESGLRVPMMVRWPGHTKKQHTCDKLVSSVDIMPTILSATGTDESSYKGGGRSFLPLLEGKDVPWRKYIYGEMTFHSPAILRVVRTVRDERFKLMKSYFNFNPREKLIPIQFYDLQKDPLASRNVADKPEYAEDVARLKKQLDDWQKETGDPLVNPETLPKWKARYEAAVAKQKAKKAQKQKKH